MEIANTMLSSELQVFLNYVYEYKKGVRNMVLCTLNRRYLAAAVALDAAFISLTLAAAAETEASPLPYSRLPSRSVH